MISFIRCTARGDKPGSRPNGRTDISRERGCFAGLPTDEKSAFPDYRLNLQIKT